MHATITRPNSPCQEETPPGDDQQTGSGTPKAGDRGGPLKPKS